MSDVKPLFAFPHSSLTKWTVSLSPSNMDVALLSKELYANAMAVHSTRGGGANGYLALTMTDAAYLARAGQPFIPPVHPGAAPVHAANATAAQLTETNRQYAADLAEHSIFTLVNEELKKQLLDAVPTKYLSILEDDEFGFADVSPATMMTHLRAHYGVITSDDLENNRARLSDAWNPDDPIEDLWVRIQRAQRFAQVGNEPIPDKAVIRLTLAVFEKTGLFTIPADAWRILPEAGHTLIAFKAHFETANKERARKMSARTAGYHGAHTATTPPVDNPTDATITDLTTGGGFHANATIGTPTTATPGTSATRTNTSVLMFYCWSHGLGINPNHTSGTCENPRTGHVASATADNMMGGNDRIMSGRGGNRNAARRNNSERYSPPHDALCSTATTNSSHICSPITQGLNVASCLRSSSRSITDSSSPNSCLKTPAQHHFPDTTHIAIADTGSTAHFASIDSPVTNKRPATSPIGIANPNGEIMYSTHTADLQIPGLPDAARHVHIVPDLSTPTLISIGQLCDAGCDVQFDKTTVTVTYHDKLVLQGTRTRASKLWHFALPVTPPANQPNAGLESSNAAIGGATPADLVEFAHASMFSPALSTLESAVKKGFLTNFPGLTLSTLRKHPPKSVAMVKGHLDQSRKNHRPLP